MTLQIMTGDCIELMRTPPDNSVDSIVTDPPYGLGFMGKAWDALPPGLEWAEECLRVLKPGGHVLAFGGSRTWHRLAVAIEDAGFELRDSIAWMYGSGFPKSQDVSKAIDKAAGANREVIGVSPHAANRSADMGYHGGAEGEGQRVLTTPATPEAQQWEGWGTALKPAFEPVVMGRKPFKGTVAANVLEHGTGALNIDACRNPIDPKDPNIIHTESRGGTATKFSGLTFNGGVPGGELGRGPTLQHPKGRFPANVILDEHTAALLDEQSGTLKSSKPGISTTKARASQVAKGAEAERVSTNKSIGDPGGASRFFYCAKAPKSERPVVDGVAHPTVKPLALMRYLITLVTPPGGVVLEPFAGSGTTVEAALMDGFGIIAMERDETYLPLIQARIDRYLATQMEDLI